MSSGSSVDCSDLIRFGSVVMRLASKKGILHELKRGSELERGYYCLFGNLLYVFDNEADANSVKGLVFLESGSCKVTNVNATPVLSISTVGGRTINLTTKEVVDLYEWQNALEAGKIVNISRKIEDSETSLVALQHKVEKLEESHVESEKLYVDMKQSLSQAQQEQQILQSQLATAEKQNVELTSLLKSSESERLLLLKSRGILPKRQPVWSLHTDESNDVLKCMKIWCGTWNLSGKEVFAHLQRERAKLVLRAFVSAGYDMYILGLQDACSEGVSELVDSVLQSEGYKRLSYWGPYTASLVPTPPPAASSSSTFSGTYIYVKNTLASDVHIANIVHFSFADGSAGGCVGVVVSVFGRVVCVINAVLDERSAEVRREQYATLCMEMGNRLGERGHQLSDQFHHIVWLGSLHPSLSAPLETLVSLLEAHDTHTLYSQYDELLADRRSQTTFFTFREASIFPNFFPTFRKIPHHGPVNFQQPGWCVGMYLVRGAGGGVGGMVSGGGGGGYGVWGGGRASKSKVKDCNPSFCDRILYCSMVDLAEDLVPEVLPTDLEISTPPHTSAAHTAPLRGSSGRFGSGVGTGVGAAHTPVTGGGVGTGGVWGEDRSHTTTLLLDNYKAIHEGEGLTASEHAPVVCTFLLRLRKSAQNHNTPPDGGCNNNNSSSTSAMGFNNNNTSSSSGGGGGGGASNNNIAEGLGGGKKGLGDITSLLSSLTTSSEVPPPATPERGGTNLLPAQNNINHTSSNNNNTIISMSGGISSMLPLGTYHIRVSECKLLWGVSEASPLRAQLLFPSPFEAKSGERFVDFMSEVVYSGGVGGVVAGGGGRTGVGGGVGSSFSGGTPNRPGSLAKRSSSANNTPVSASSMKDAQWRNVGPSRTGTCICLESARAAQDYLDSPGPLPSVMLTWRGEEPLERLHISMKVSMLSQGIRSASAASSGFSDDDDVLSGHCALSLASLCGLAVRGEGCSVSATRMLMSRGKPMYCVDPKTLQREVVSLHCKLELVTK